MAKVAETAHIAKVPETAKMAEMAKTGLGRANSDDPLALLKNKGSNFYVFFPEQQLNLLVLVCGVYDKDILRILMIRN